MHYRFLPSLFLALVSTVFAKETAIGGEQSGFLTVENSPYIVTETIVVNEGKALAIAEGVRLLFKPGTGIDVRGGSFAIEGDASAIVELSNASEGSTWNGITITGNETVDINNAKIAYAETAVAVENGSVTVRNATIQNSKTAISAKSAKIEIQNTSFANSSGTAINANASHVSIDASSFEQNKVAVFASNEADITLVSTTFSKNEYAIVDLGYNRIREHDSPIENNKVGIIASDIPLKNLKSAAQNNEVDIMPGADSLAKTLPPIRNIEYAEKYKQVAVSEGVKDSAWTLSGNVGAYVGYHLVRTRHDSRGERYNNYFQTPGFFGGLNTYLKLESPAGKTLEFTADLYSDQWNHFNVRTVNLTYFDEMQRLSLGDSYVKAGDLYLAGINVFGGVYDIKLFSIASGMPMFEVEAFGGETKAPKIVGNRDKENYKDWIEEDDAEAQEIVVGGKIKWNMHRRFNGTLGFIGSKDYLEDPFLRDGMSSNHTTVEPMVTSRTFFADGNWLFWPGDIELNGQIAAGAADTSDVYRQRAINEVFGKAGLSVSNYPLLRKLMQSPQLVSTLSSEELTEIFGDSQVMTPSEMRSVLRKLLEDARVSEKNIASEKDEQGNIDEWDAQNLAAMGSLRWKIAKTTISVQLKIIGKKFYSAGSPDALNNYRSFSFGVDQQILDSWKMSLLYNGYVENASKGDKYNIFGLYEGTTVGLFQESSKKWEKEHEQDIDRALSAHNANLTNTVKLGDFTISLKYKSDFKKRHRPTRLYANYSVESGIYEDSWFKPDRGSETISFVSGEDTVYVDVGKFEKYYDLANENYLATGFEERVLKHIAEAEVAWKLPKNVLKVGGVWTYRTDLSKFEDDDLLDYFDFSDKTYGALGYYFHGADFFEQKYPISLNTNLEIFKNNIAFTPRYKIYNRDNMKEFEWTLNDYLEIPLSKDFMELSLNGEFRQLFIRRHQEGNNEMEADLDGSATLRVHYTKDLFSDYTLGAYYAYRPDSRQDEYKDFYGMFTLNYAF